VAACVAVVVSCAGPLLTWSQGPVETASASRPRRLNYSFGLRCAGDRIFTVEQLVYPRLIGLGFLSITSTWGDFLMCGRA